MDRRKTFLFDSALLSQKEQLISKSKNRDQPYFGDGTDKYVVRALACSYSNEDCQRILLEGAVMIYDKKEKRVVVNGQILTMCNKNITLRSLIMGDFKGPKLIPDTNNRIEAIIKDYK